MKEFWEQASEIIMGLSLETALEIIEDAQSHGFEFKVEDGKLYYSETAN